MEEVVRVCVQLGGCVKHFVDVGESKVTMAQKPTVKPTGGVLGSLEALMKEVERQRGSATRCIKHFVV